MKRIGTLVAAAALSACAAIDSPPLTDAASAPARSAAERLQSVMDADWERRLQASPLWLASMIGDRRYNDRWADLGAEAIAADHPQRRQLLAALEAIDRGALSAGDRLNHDLLVDELRTSIERDAFRTHLMPISHMFGIQSVSTAADRLRFTTAQDYRDWIARLEAFGTYVDQHIALMREGIAAGIVPPRVVMERVPEQIAAQVVESAEDSPFYAPFRRLPESLEAAESEALAEAGRAAITDTVLPAFRRFQAFFNAIYLPACRDGIAASALPDGERFYAFEVRRFTTTELDPEAVHATGLAEVARIRAQMDAIIDQVGFDGSFAEFLHFLRTDPQFYHDSPEALLTGYRDIAKRIDPELVKLFGRLPRMPYGVIAMPAAIAPDAPTAYYSRGAADGSRAGMFLANTHKPETRPKYEMEALTVHEAMPGHHLQIALQQELGGLPMFRRFGGYTAFVEGWGLYSESLGEALGLYTDPYSKFGQLTYEMWRAIRLVVDTGMHHKGWTRQQAIDYFKANAGKSENDIVNEIDRYIAWPGQALAYKVGELRIQALRRQAEQALGEGFDIRAFHDTVLGAGAVPLNILERRVQAWIAEQAGDAG